MAAAILLTNPQIIGPLKPEGSFVRPQTSVPMENLLQYNKDKEIAPAVFRALKPFYSKRMMMGRRYFSICLFAG